MVVVAQLVLERWFVAPEAAGSSPVSHPNGIVAQLVRALACHARGRGFESRQFRQFLQVLDAFSNPISLSIGENNR